MNGFKKRLPIGMENFEEIRREDFYYVDKTAMIRDLLRSGGKGYSVYPSKAIWKIAEYEHVEILF